jgi:hypothetical protein
MKDQDFSFERELAKGRGFLSSITARGANSMCETKLKTKVSFLLLAALIVSMACVLLAAEEQNTRISQSGSQRHDQGSLD